MAFLFSYRATYIGLFSPYPIKGQGWKRVRWQGEGGGGAKGDEELYTVQNAFWGSRVEMQCKQSILCLKKVRNVGQTIQSVDIKKDKCHVMSHKSMPPFTLVA